MELTLDQLKQLIDLFTELQTDKILINSVNKVSEILNAKGCSLFLFDEGENKIRLAETTGTVPKNKNNITYSKGEGLTGWVFKYKKPLLIQNLDKKDQSALKKEFGQDINWVSKFVEGTSDKASSFIAVPIISQNGRFIGVIRSSSTEENFTKEDLSLLSNIAGYIGIAIENGNMYLQEHKKADYFKLLTEIGTKLHSHYTLKDLLDFVAEEVSKTFSSETSEIYLKDQAQPEILVLKAGYGIPRELINKAVHFIGEGLTGTLVKEKRTIRLNNVLNYPKYKGKYRNKMKENLKHGDRLAFLGIPIIVKNDAIGCIKLYNKIPKYNMGTTYFTEDDEQYLDILGYMLSFAIENLQYLDSMQTSAIKMVKTQRLTALGTMAIRLPNEITNSLTTAQLAVKNLMRRIQKNSCNDNPDKILKKLATIDNSLREAAGGVKTLQDFSTRAGFLKVMKTWQEIIDESLLFLSDEILHKKINIIRRKDLEDDLPELMVEPNEMIEVMINLFLISIEPIRHYKSDIFVITEVDDEKKHILTRIRSVDKTEEIPLENKIFRNEDEMEIVTPQKFMLHVAKEIIINNYQGALCIKPDRYGIFIELVIPIGGEGV